MPSRTVYCITKPGYSYLIWTNDSGIIVAAGGRFADWIGRELVDLVIAEKCDWELVKC